MSQLACHPQVANEPFGKMQDNTINCLPTAVSRNSAEMEDVRRSYQIVLGLIHDNI